jgi:hypothetical protein
VERAELVFGEARKQPLAQRGIGAVKDCRDGGHRALQVEFQDRKKFKGSQQRARPADKI